MNVQLTKQERMLLLFSVLLVILVIVGSYFFYIVPKNQEVSAKEVQLESEKQLLLTLQSQANERKAPSAASVAELQKKVPVKKQLELLILDLNKAEVVANSHISNMTFNEGTVSAPAAEESAENFPEGIKKLTVNLSVASPSYRDLMSFLQTLEALNRRVVIENVSFSGGSELTSIQQEKQEFTYSLTLSAFYMPELGDLEGQLPELKAPSPSNKRNPFATSADVN